MKFPLQVALASVVVASCITALVLVGRAREADAQKHSSTVPGLPVLPPAQKLERPPLAGADTILRRGHKVRDLVPPTAWLVVDFRGDLSGQLPFSGQAGLCEKVPAPARMALGILPPSGSQNPEVLIAAREVSDEFWGCARDRIVRAGGTPLAQNAQYEVLKSPTGVVARGPAGSMVFLTGEAHLEAALSVLSELTPGAASTGAHAALSERLRGDGPAAATDLDLTLALPADWLASVGQDREKSPLRFVSSAFVSLRQDGSAQGGVDCDESGCDEVLKFLERAKKDLSSGLPPTAAAAIGASLTARHIQGSGRILVEWSPTTVALSQLLGGFLGAAGLGTP